MARDETKNLKEHIKGTRSVNPEDSQALDPASWNLRDLMTCLHIQRAFGRPAANATGQGGVLAVGNDSTADVGDEGDVECNEYRAAGKVDVEGTGILDHRNRPRTAPAVEIRYLFDKDFSRKCSTSKDDFDKCLRILEQDMLPLPTSVRTNVDPRECFNMDRWRFAVEEELGLTSKWRRDDRKGFLLRLTAIRLRAEDDRLHCWPVPILGLYCTLEDVTKFVNTHPVCQLGYCIDFQSEENVIEWDSMTTTKISTAREVDTQVAETRVCSRCLTSSKLGSRPYVAFVKLVSWEKISEQRRCCECIRAGRPALFRCSKSSPSTLSEFHRRANTWFVAAST